MGGRVRELHFAHNRWRHLPSEIITVRVGVVTGSGKCFIGLVLRGTCVPVGGPAARVRRGDCQKPDRVGRPSEAPGMKKTKQKK